MTHAAEAATNLAGRVLVPLLLRTLRTERVGVENFERFRHSGTPVVFVFWHGQLLPLVHMHREEGIVVLVSRHRDGEVIARILARSGFGTVRGSSTRGGAFGLRALVSAVRAGRDVAITPDGPRGPRGVFRPGALSVARLTGAPVVPLAVRVSPVWRLRSWDGFLVPKPFATVRVEYLAPRLVPRHASRDELRVLAEEIGAELDAVQDGISSVKDARGGTR